MDITLAGVDAVCEMIETSVMPSGVEAFEEDDDEDGFDKDGLEAAAVVRLEAMGVANEGMEMFAMCTRGGSTDVTLQMESVSGVL